jgi:hypothetical protein
MEPSSPSNVVFVVPKDPHRSSPPDAKIEVTFTATSSLDSRDNSRDKINDANDKAVKNSGDRCPVSSLYCTGCPQVCPRLLVNLKFL